MNVKKELVSDFDIDEVVREAEVQLGRHTNNLYSRSNLISNWLYTLSTSGIAGTFILMNNQFILKEHFLRCEEIFLCSLCCCVIGALIEWIQPIFVRNKIFKYFEKLESGEISYVKYKKLNPNSFWWFRLGSAMKIFG